MCELLVGQPAGNVVGVEDADPLRIHAETNSERLRCDGCGGRVWVKDRPVVNWWTFRASGGGHARCGASAAGIAFGFRNFANYRIRSLLYAGRPNWTLLATITPR